MIVAKYGIDESWLGCQGEPNLHSSKHNAKKCKFCFFFGPKTWKMKIDNSKVNDKIPVFFVRTLCFIRTIGFHWKCHPSSLVTWKYERGITISWKMSSTIIKVNWTEVKFCGNLFFLWETIAFNTNDNCRAIINVILYQPFKIIWSKKQKKISHH